jgi:hypothetical protein
MCTETDPEQIGPVAPWLDIPNYYRRRLILTRRGTSPPFSQSPHAPARAPEQLKALPAMLTRDKGPLDPDPPT